MKLLIQKLYLLALCAVSFNSCASDAVIGVNLVNSDQIGTKEQSLILDSLEKSNVHFIRAIISPDERGIRFAKMAYDRGIRIDAILGFGGVKPGTALRPYLPKLYPRIWAATPLSGTDPELFRLYFTSFLGRLDAANIKLEAFELGNEINMVGFNSDFAFPGKGRQFGLNDLYHDPAAQRVAKGYLQYLKLLSVLKDVRGKSKLNSQTPILTAGFGVNEVPDGKTNSKEMDQVSFRATIEYMRSNGLDELVDGYSVHLYPWSNGPGQLAAAADRRARLAQYTVPECQPLGSNRGKPCWITEWGFSDAGLACPFDDDRRATLVREMMDNFRPYAEEGRFAGLFYFSWNSSPWLKRVEPFSVFRCGALTKSGAFALDPALLH